MKIAFCLYKYFSYGGLQTYFFRIWEECQRRGHESHVFTRRWEGDKPKGMNLHLIPAPALTNIGKDSIFAKNLRSRLTKGNFDVVVGFNKIPELDVYLQADPCYLALQKNQNKLSCRSSRRFRFFSQNEAAVFHRDSTTRILLLAEPEKANFQKYYDTPEDRFTLLPPLPLVSRPPKPEDIPALRSEHRQRLGIRDDEFLILFVASNFKLKGLDRAVRALAELPDKIRRRSYLYVIGKDSTARFKLLALLKGVADRVKFLGARSELLEMLLPADLLVHPAYQDNTGTIIYQAIVSGLPVLATDVCGFSKHILNSGSGKVISSPFSQEKFQNLMAEMLTSPERKIWSQKGLNYFDKTSREEMQMVAMNLIEKIAAQKSAQRKPHS